MTAAAGDPPDKDQSMDDILASIRRIMLDEQARLQDTPGGLTYAAARPPAAPKDPVLILDSSMVVEGMPAESLNLSQGEETVILVSSEDADMPSGSFPVEPVLDAKAAVTNATLPVDAATADAGVPVARAPETSAHTTILGATGAVPVDLEAGHQSTMISAQAIEALMAPAAAAAAAASVEALLKQLSEERLSALQPAAARTAPTIEEVVRSELRPFLKAWLDEHLPPMVERLVRTEISRLIGRSGF